jgi:hypothetical protein
MMLLRGQLQLREDLLTDYQLKSRMTGDCHVRFREGLGGSSPGLLDCLRQPGQLLNRPLKFMRVNINPLIKSSDLIQKFVFDLDCF